MGQSTTPKNQTTAGRDYWITVEYMVAIRESLLASYCFLKHSTVPLIYHLPMYY